MIMYNVLEMGSVQSMQNSVMTLSMKKDVCNDECDQLNNLR